VVRLFRHCYLFSAPNDKAQPPTGVQNSGPEHAGVQVSGPSAAVSPGVGLGGLSRNAAFISSDTVALGTQVSFISLHQD